MKNVEVQKIRSLVSRMQTDLKRLLQELVRTNSVATPPEGNETTAQRILLAFFRAHGVRAELYPTEFIKHSGNAVVKKDRVYRKRPNLCVRLSGNGRGKTLLLNGHMDTVPAGKANWSRSPWSGAYVNGNVHGLGSFDMKGGIVANAAAICVLKEAGITTGGDVIFESVIDEEWGGGGGSLAARLRDGGADACVIPEGTQLEIYRATRGGFVVDLHAQAGDPSNYFSTSEVLSPAIPLGRLLGWVDGLARDRARIRPTGAYAKFANAAPVQVLAVQANAFDRDVPLSVPSEAALRLYIQFLPEEDVDAVIGDIEKSLRRFESDDPFFSKHPIAWHPFIQPALHGHELAEDHPWTQCMVGAASVVLGRVPVVTGAPYPCDAGLIHREFGIPTLLFGPCGAGAHNPNEYVTVQSVLDTATILTAAALEWTNG